MSRRLTPLGFPALFRIFTAIVLLLTQSGFARSVKEYKISSETFRYAPASDPGNPRQLKYTLLKFPAPRESEKFPLLMLIHGSQEDGSAYIDYWRKTAVSRRMMLVAPEIERVIKGGAKDVKEYTDLVRSLAEKYPVDSERIYILGVSSGTLVARWAAEDHPEFWKKVVSVASQTGEHWMKRRDLSGFPPFLFVHGEKDHEKAADIVQLAVWIRESLGQADVVIDTKAGHEYRYEWTELISDWLLDGKKPQEKI